MKYLLPEYWIPADQLPVWQPIRRCVRLPPEGVPFEEIESQAIIEALRLARWVQKDAAAKLSMSARRLSYKMKVLGIEQRADYTPWVRV